MMPDNLPDSLGPVPAFPGTQLRDPAEPPEGRAFGDAKATRKAIYSNVLEAARAIPPVENTRYALSLHDLDWADPDEYPLSRQKQAVLENTTLHRRLRGTWRLTDKESGKVLEEKKATVAQVPHYTDRGTFIINGNEISVINQLRLRPGIFSRVKENGETESHVNALPGKGLGHRYNLDPETGVYKMTIGQGTIPLMPVLKLLGTTDSELRKAWGDELFGENSKANDPRSIDKLYQRLVKRKPKEDTPDSRREAVIEALYATEFDPEVTARTLGKPYTRLSKEAILDTTVKLLGMARGEVQPDDRDHMAFQKLHGPEDLMAERYQRAGPALRQLLWQVTNKGNLSPVKVNALGKPAMDAILGSGLSQMGEEVNSLDMYDLQSKVTRMGVGGISDTSAIPDEARTVQPSHHGFIDSVRTPECYSADTEVLTETGWKAWPQVTLEDRLACLVAGRLEYHRPIRLMRYDYAGPLYGAETDEIAYLVTAEHRTWSMALDDLELCFESAEAAHGQDRLLVCRLDEAVPGLYSEGSSGNDGSNGFVPVHDQALISTPGSALVLAASRTTVQTNVPTGATRSLFSTIGSRRGEQVPGGLPEASEDEVRSNQVSSVLWSEAGVTEPGFELALTAPSREGVPPSSCSSPRGHSPAAFVSARDYFTTPYNGKVYCAEVPGGLLYVRRLGKRGFWCGNSMRAGVESRMARGVIKGKDGNLYARYKDPNTNDYVWKTPSEVADLTLGFHEAYHRGEPYVGAVHQGKIMTVPREAVNLIQPPMDEAFSPLTSMVPLKPAVKAQRVSMGARFMLQAMPLKEPEAPLVRTRVPGEDRSFEELLGKHAGAVHADDQRGGRVTKVDKNGIQIKYEDGKTETHDLYDNFPLARKTGIHNTPVVQEGDLVKPGQLLATSNYTDDTGAAALGKNLRVAFIARGGKNYEDAYAISEKAAKDLTSEHHYQQVHEWDPERHVQGKNSFVSIFPSIFDKKTMDNMDDDGIVKEGMTVKHGDPLVLVAQKREGDYKTVHSPHKGAFSDQSQTWDHDEDGVVTDVVKTQKGVTVAVKSYMPLKIGDKVSGRFGNKGVVSEVIRDDEMPHDEQGQPYDLLANPLGVISRCYDEQTELLTNRGWKRMADVHPKDEVFCFDPGLFERDRRQPRWYMNEASFFVWQRQTEPMFVQDYQGLMTRFVTASVDLLVTPNHRMFVSWPNNDVWEEATAEQVRTRAHFALVADRPVVGDGRRVAGNRGVPTHAHAAIIGPDACIAGPYEGRVYCPTVPTGWVVVRRRGKVTVSGNTNPSQIIEAGLGKVAEKTGRPYKVEDFSPHMDDLTEWAIREMDRHGVPDLETVTDPKTGKKIPDVMTGNQFYMKLHHLAEGKGSGRGLGGVSADDQPVKGGPEGAKRFASQDLNAVLSSGALEVLRDTRLVKGQSNPEYWAAHMAGYKPSTPKVPFVYEKFVNYLKGSGVNVTRDGSNVNIFALTNKDVDRMSNGRTIDNSDTVDWRNGMKPIKGGLFDPTLTGGHGGKLFAKIPLHEPMPNPVMEDPIKHLLGLTGKQFEAVLGGTEKLQGRSGPEAITEALKAIDVDKAAEQARLTIASGRKTARADAVKQLGILKMCQKKDMHPSEWMLSGVPVLPPAYRPVSQMGGGRQMIADPNYLLKEVIDANDNLKNISGKVEDTSSERLTLYNAFKGYTGLGDPIQPKNQERGVKGLLRSVFGDRSKYNAIQYKLLTSPINLIGRGVIIPNPDLNMDQVGLPEPMAWNVYTPFVIRRLVKSGVDRSRALAYVQEKHPLARKAMVEEMEDRPVMVNRAPVLHRWGHIALFPRITNDHTIHINPYVISGLGADFDGDAQIGVVIIGVARVLLDALYSREPYPGFWEDHRVSGYLFSHVHFCIDHEFFCVNLEEFPHLDDRVEYDGGRVARYSLPPGVFVLAYEEEANRVKFAEVSHWSRHEKCAVVVVNLHSGRQIVTDDDPRAVYGMDLKTYTMVRRRPGESIGLFVPRVDRCADLFEEGVLTAIQGGDGKRVPKEIELTRDFGRLCGMLAGNGWVSCGVHRGAQVHIAATDPGVQERYRQVVATVLPERPKIGVVTRTAEDGGGYGPSTRFTVSSNSYADLAFRLVNAAPGHTARDKRLPPFTLWAPREFRLGLLEGLMDTDGSVSVSHGKATPQLMVNFSSSSLRLIQEFQQLLRSLDVTSRITASKTPKGDPFWALNISTVDIKRLPLDLSHTERKRIWDTGPTPNAESPAAHKIDILPFPVALAEQLLPRLNRKTTDSRQVWDACYRSSKTGTITRSQALRVLSAVGGMGALDDPTWQTFFQVVIDTDTRWDQVDSIEVTGIEETAYDLTVPGSETFMTSEGVILSNTSNFTLPVSDEAKDEAVAKMLPSRNLLAASDFKTPMFQPRQEYSAGLYVASTKKNKDKPTKTFATMKDLRRAWWNGHVDPGDDVNVVNEK